MAHRVARFDAEGEAFLRAHGAKSLLRFITCGSVDDGKSTLIGRLLYDTKLILEDQLAALEAESRHGSFQGRIDFASLVDGLAAEREQGITIDVAYRFFSTDRRKFIVADCPGHEQYTRNMVTGASTADLAVILVDARKGVLTQTRRHSHLVRLLGIRHVVLAVNKMDLVGYDQRVFDRIVAEYRTFAARLGVPGVVAIPMSARKGDNIVTRSPAMSWYAGQPLVEHLETVEVVDGAAATSPLRFPVQWVNRPNQDFRGFAGTVAGGGVHPGDPVRVLPSGREARVVRIATYDGDLPEAVAGQSVTLCLDREVDVSRGDMIVGADAPAEVADQFEATIVWMADEPLLPGRPYWIKIGAKTVPATITDIKHQLDVDTFGNLPAKTLTLNAIGICNLQTSEPIAFDAYQANRDIGGFILIDRLTNATLGAGMIHFALRRSHNIHWQALDVDREARAALKGQRPAVLWFTGLSGAGKSTIANLVEKRLHALGRHTYTLDGDNVRHGLNRDLGFTDADRVENIRRVAEVAKLMADAGLIVMVSFISPFRAERRLAREMIREGEFIEVFVDTPLAEAERRDVKGLYKKARAGELSNFTGINSPYEAPESPEIHIGTMQVTPEAAAEAIVDYLIGPDSPAIPDAATGDLRPDRSEAAGRGSGATLA